VQSSHWATSPAPYYGDLLDSRAVAAENRHHEHAVAADNRDHDRAAAGATIPQGRPVTRVSRSRGRVLLEYGLMLLVAIAVAYAAEALAVKPFVIPTASMANTVQPGDRVLIDRVSYRFRAIRPGDIIAFGGHGPIPLLKRVVGLPGDRLSLAAGRLFVNGQPSPLAWVRRLDGRLEPTLPGPQQSVPWSLAQPYVVPAGQYFAMGDNRTDSDDSRYWGTVSRGQIIGKAFFVYWPVQHVKGL